jgi:hypothetical protein
MDMAPAFSNPPANVAVLTGQGQEWNRVVATSPNKTAPGSDSVPAAVATSQPGLSGSPSTPAPPSPNAPPPPLQIIRDSKINLHYTVRDLGPSGLGSVELWVTRDNGQTWQPAGGMQNINPSTAADVKGVPGAVQLSLPVELPAEGVYGFYIVARSKANLGTPAPQPGTPPRLRVELDMTLPEATLYQPQPKPGHQDTLVLTWEARDKNLAPNPITLEWAERRDGAWQLIGKDLPNAPTGYTWQLPAGTVLPPRVYLRLTVHDTAGNLATAETPEPVLIDFKEPVVSDIQLGGPVHP